MSKYLVTVLSFAHVLQCYKTPKDFIKPPKTQLATNGPINGRTDRPTDQQTNRPAEWLIELHAPPILDHNMVLNQF